MLWGSVLPKYVLGDDGRELGGCGFLGVGVEEVAGEGCRCVKGLRLGGVKLGLRSGAWDGYGDCAFGPSMAAESEYQSYASGSWKKLRGESNN